MTSEEYARATKRLSKMHFSFKQGGMEFETFWNRIYVTGNERWNYKKHHHSFFEIHLCMHGECRMAVENKEIVLKSGTYLVITPQKSHKILSVSNDFSKFVIGVKITSLEKGCIYALNQFENDNAEPKVKNYTAQMITAIDSIIDNSHTRQFNYYEIITVELYHLIILIMRHSSNLAGLDFSSAVNDSDARAIAVKKFIRDNLSQKYSNESIARQFNTSSRQLTRILFNSTGMTIASLKRSIQVEAICEYLKNTDLSLKEIAQKTGFSDEFSLSKVFKKVEGMPPSEYRKGSNTRK